MKCIFVFFSQTMNVLQKVDFRQFCITKLSRFFQYHICHFLVNYFPFIILDKLTKNIINSVDIVSSIESFKSTEETLSLRISGQLILGLMRIFLKKCVYILSELQDFLTQPSVSKSTHLKEQITATTQYITLSDRKQKLITIEDTISASSLLGSAKESIEQGRNLVLKENITLDEINYTPRSIHSQIMHELTPAETFLQELTPLQPIKDEEMPNVDTPAISLNIATPATIRKTPRAVSSRHKYKIKEDKATSEKSFVEYAQISKQHAVYKENSIPLDSLTLFHKCLLNLPAELKEIYNNSFFC